MNSYANTQTKSSQAPIPSFIPTASKLLQRKCACGGTPGPSGECAECAKKRQKLQRKVTHKNPNDTGFSPSSNLVMQRKLTIGSSDDPLEKEADRIADQVMTKSIYSKATDTPLRIQRSTEQANGQMNTAPASVNQVLAGSGKPLEPVLQQDMEQRFGHDFSQVRIHTGSAAEKSAQDVSARAYTVGQNVVFGANQFAPRSTEGRRLLAHELTHVIQQGRADSTIVPEEDLETGDSTLQKHEAISADKTVGNTSRQATPKLSSGLRLQREACPCCASSISIDNISRIDNARQMGHSFDAMLDLQYPASGPEGSCTLEWWEKTNVPAIRGHTPNTWTDMYALAPTSPTFNPWRNRSESCGASLPVTINDPPALGRGRGRTVTRTLEFRIVINSMPASSESGCTDPSQEITAKQILTMVNGAPDWSASSFTTP